MNQPLPRTPFSTPLSGSARETELRIRNIMSGPKKRPPLLFLALMFSMCIFCGNLVSCQMIRISFPVPPFMVMPADLIAISVEIILFLTERFQYIAAYRSMCLHNLELPVRQLPGF